MYNRVKFVLRLSLLQKFKKKEIFVINKKLHKKLSKPNNIIIRKFHSSNEDEPHNPFNLKIIIASIICGSFFVFKKINK
jgi:hypothetical protein